MYLTLHIFHICGGYRVLLLGRRAAVSLDEVQCDFVRILDLVLETTGSTRDFADSALRLLPGWWFATFPLPLRPSQAARRRG